MHALVANCTAQHLGQLCQHARGVCVSREVDESLLRLGRLQRLRLRLRLNDDVCGRVDSSGEHGAVAHQRQRADGGGGSHGHRREQKGAKGVAKNGATTDCTHRETEDEQGGQRPAGRTETLHDTAIRIKAHIQ